MPVAGSTCESPEAQTLTPHGHTSRSHPPLEPAIWQGGGFLYCRYIVLGIKIVIFAEREFNIRQL
nr:MAG TPA: hypothetical protein [Caudoviricetes sp.]